MTQPKKDNISLSASNRSARLVAVQTLYGVLHTGDEMKEVLADILSRSDKLEIEGEALVPPERSLLSKILGGVDEHRETLDEMIMANLTTKKSGETELLLKSILLCGACELLAHSDIDAPLIINDYVDVAHGFYESGQVKLINGVLDSINKSIRT